jgi:hypothetical protein
LVSPFARLVVALNERSRSLEGDTCFCLAEADVTVAPKVPVVAPAGLAVRPVLVFLVFIFIFLIKIAL